MPGFEAAVRVREAKADWIDWGIGVFSFQFSVFGCAKNRDAGFALITNSKLKTKNSPEPIADILLVKVIKITD
jgi:hypothetical protein